MDDVDDDLAAGSDFISLENDKVLECDSIGTGNDELSSLEQTLRRLQKRKKELETRKKKEDLLEKIKQAQGEISSLETNGTQAVQSIGADKTQKTPSSNVDITLEAHSSKVDKTLKPYDLQTLKASGSKVVKTQMTPSSKVDKTLKPPSLKVDKTQQAPSSKINKTMEAPGLKVDKTIEATSFKVHKTLEALSLKVYDTQETPNLNAGKTQVASNVMMDKIQDISVLNADRKLGASSIKTCESPEAPSLEASGLHEEPSEEVIGLLEASSSKASEPYEASNIKSNGSFEAPILEMSGSQHNNDIDSWNEETLDLFFESKGIDVRKRPIQELKELAKAISISKLCDYTFQAECEMESQTVFIRHRKHAFPSIANISDWLDDLSLMPCVEHFQVNDYFLSTGEFVLNIRPLKSVKREHGYSLHKFDGVKAIQIHHLEDGFCYLKCKCLDDEVWKCETVWCLLHSGGCVELAGCSCRGDSRCCDHIIALLLSLISVSTEVQTERFQYKKAKAVLSGLTRKTLKLVAKKMADLPFVTLAQLKEVTCLVYEKAMLDPLKSDVYAQLCRYLNSIKVPSESKQEEFVTFRSLLLTRCQREYEQVFMDANEDNDTKKSNDKNISSLDVEINGRSLGTIRFIGELFNLKMLTEPIMHELVYTLVNMRSDLSLEAASILLKTIGKAIDTEKAKPRMDQYFSRIKTLIENRWTCPRVISLLQEVVELRQKNWIMKQ